MYKGFLVLLSASCLSACGPFDSIDPWGAFDNKLSGTARFGIYEVGASAGILDEIYRVILLGDVVAVENSDIGITAFELKEYSGRTYAKFQLVNNSSVPLQLSFEQFGLIDSTQSHLSNPATTYAPTAIGIWPEDDDGYVYAHNPVNPPTRLGLGELGAVMRASRGYFQVHKLPILPPASEAAVALFFDTSEFKRTSFLWHIGPNNSGNSLVYMATSHRNPGPG